MRYLKSFNESRNEGDFLTDPIAITKVLQDNTLFRINFPFQPRADWRGVSDKIYRIREGGIVDVDGDVTVDSRRIKKLPIRFGDVNGDFIINDGGILTTLEGSPERCFNFICRYSSIENLIGGPKYVGGYYDVENSSLTSLEGAPEEVNGYFDCKENPLTSLEFSPRRVAGFFDCSDTKIESLEGSPEFVGDTFYSNNTDLESLKGMSKECKAFEFYTKNNTLWNPEGLRDTDCEIIRCGGEPLSELINLFNFDPMHKFESLDLGNRKIVFSHFKESLDYNYLRQSGDTRFINLFRLEEALNEFDLTVPSRRKKMKHYVLVDDDGNPVDFRGKRL